MKEIELYIHIPFCVRKCNYCDFLSFSAGEEAYEAYTKALLKEISQTGSYLSSQDPDKIYPAKEYEVCSIFIGGGTPSILPISSMEEILSRIHDSFSIKAGAEISMESNPGTLNPEKLKAYHSMGINRLSMGLQSTDDNCLKMLGRIHTFDEFMENYQAARRNGFDNINIDMMSALPGQTLSSYINGLEMVTNLQPEHISSYSLIVEEGTPFYKNEKLLDLLPDEDTERKMYEMTEDLLIKRGYHRYEISNYAKKGRECIHNIGYWDDVAYLGLGLGSSSYWKEGGKCRFSNTRDFTSYLARPFRPFEKREEYQRIGREESMEEFMFLGLRKMDGVSCARFRLEFGCDMEDIYGPVIGKYIDLKLLARKGDRLCLTKAGINVSNRIFSDFLLV